MTLNRTRGGAGPQRGLSLIELMISITLGLIIVLAMVAAYLGSSGAGRMAEAQARMNEDGQAALTILSQQLRMAGNNPKRANRTSAAPRNPVFDNTTYIVRACDGTFSNITAAANIQALTCAAGGGAAPDSIAISYEADTFNTVPTAGAAATDCLGQALPTVTANVTEIDGAGPGTAVVPKTFFVADNRFYIGTSSVITAPSLYCKGNGSANPQPLVENVEDLQITYGAAPATAPTLVVGGYLSAGELLANTDLAALADDQSRWGRVLTARVCVLVRSEQPVAPDAASARYTQCNGVVNNAPSDLRLRRAYSTTVVLRNRLAS